MFLSTQKDQIKLIFNLKKLDYYIYKIFFIRFKYILYEVNFSFNRKLDKLKIFIFLILAKIDD
jgi:hypothetical protein